MKELPERPALGLIKKEAKQLFKRLKDKDTKALLKVNEYHPLLKGKPSIVFDWEYKLADAQVVTAREYGFTSWNKLKEEVEGRAE